MKERVVFLGFLDTPYRIIAVGQYGEINYYEYDK